MELDLIVLANGANVIDTAKNLTGGVTDVLKSVALLAAIGVVVTTYFKTRAWVPTLVAIVMAGFVVWAVNNTGFLSDSTDRTIRANSQADIRTVAAVDAPHDRHTVRHVAAAPDRGL